MAVFVREKGGRVRGRGESEETGENSTLEIRRTYVARNASAGKLHRDARARAFPAHPPRQPGFSALSTPSPTSRAELPRSSRRSGSATIARRR